MNPPPPLLRDQRAIDQEHLQLLAIFHFVVAGFAFLGIGFLFLHYQLMSRIMNNPQVWQGKQGQPPFPPQQFFAIFKWFYVIFGFFLVLAAAGNLLGGLFIRARKHRVFCLVIAGLDCLQIPFGTVLGVFTIVILTRNSVIELYQQEAPPRI